jgi:hypothetical protein
MQTGGNLERMYLASIYCERRPKSEPRCSHQFKSGTGHEVQRPRLPTILVLDEILDSGYKAQTVLT